MAAASAAARCMLDDISAVTVFFGVRNFTAAGRFRWRA
jgi:hypothetical protein